MTGLGRPTRLPPRRAAGAVGSALVALLALAGCAGHTSTALRVETIDVTAGEADLADVLGVVQAAAATVDRDAISSRLAREASVLDGDWPEGAQLAWIPAADAPWPQPAIGSLEVMAAVDGDAPRDGLLARLSYRAGAWGTRSAVLELLGSYAWPWRPGADYHLRAEAVVDRVHETFLAAFRDAIRAALEARGYAWEVTPHGGVARR